MVVRCGSTSWPGLSRLHEADKLFISRRLANGQDFPSPSASIVSSSIYTRTRLSSSSLSRFASVVLPIIFFALRLIFRSCFFFPSLAISLAPCNLNSRSLSLGNKDAKKPVYGRAEETGVAGLKKKRRRRRKKHEN